MTVRVRDTRRVEIDPAPSYSTRSRLNPGRFAFWRGKGKGTLKDVKPTAFKSDSARFSRALRSAILWPVCVILFTALLILVMLLMLMKVVKWSEHSYDVIAQTRDCEKLVIDSQNGLRGYIISGDKAFPAAFAAERSTADKAFTRLVTLVQDNRDQEGRALDLSRFKDLWFDHARTLMDQRAQGNNPVDFLKMGDDVMDKLRAQFQTFIQVEEQQHEDRRAQVNSAKTAIGFAGGALALILALTVSQLVRRQFTQLAVDYRSALHTIEQRHAALVRSEADLEQQKEWFRVALTSIGDGVIVTDQENRIVFMNHEAERLTGWVSVEALLKPLSSVFNVTDENKQHTEDPFGESLGRMPGRMLLFSRNGDQWPIDDSNAAIHDSKGRPLGQVIVFRDATEMRRAQNSLRIHSQELEKRVAERTTVLQQTVSELETFSYTVSHDLRSPLRAMQGFAQAVLEDYGAKLDEQGKNYLARIKNAAERLDRLIQDLLFYTRISRQNVPLTSLDLDKLLPEIVQNYPNLHPPGAEVQIDRPLPNVIGHEASLTQVFSNLLGNAAKFVPEGQVARIHVWGEDLGKRARIWIEDNGIGIEPEDRDRIFQMFVQVNEPHLYGGTGVGLAIVKKAVETMHGAVGVESTPGQGSKFWVELEKTA